MFNAGGAVASEKISQAEGGAKAELMVSARQQNTHDATSNQSRYVADQRNIRPCRFNSSACLFHRVYFSGWTRACLSFLGVERCRRLVEHAIMSLTASFFSPLVFLRFYRCCRAGDVILPNRQQRPRNAVPMFPAEWAALSLTLP